MGYTNFPRGITSFGMPVFGGGVPPITGQYYHVNPRIGSASNTGKEPSTAYANFETAENSLATDVGDGIIVWSQGATAANTTSELSAAMTFDKSGCTVFGVHAGQRWKGRARVIAPTAVSAAYVIDVSGSNNSFYNMHFGNEGTANTNLGCLRVTGDRNYFYNCHFVGAGHTTPGAVALAAGSSYGAHDILLSSQENTFERCTFGDNSVIRASTSANLVLSTGMNGKNDFVNCIFLKTSTTATAGAIGCYATDTPNGHVYFDNCIFSCWYSNEPDVSNTSALIGAAPTNAGLIMHNCGLVGYAAWDSVGTTKVYVTSAAGAATGGVGAGG